MNVLFVQPALPLYRVPFFERLQQAYGWSVTVWSDHRSALHANCGPTSFATAHRPERHWRGLVSQPALFDSSFTSWADVIVLSWNTRYVELLPALLAARAHHKPVVLWGHGYSKREGSLRRFVRNCWGRLATACVTYSEPARARLIAEGASPERIFCAPNALHDGPLYTSAATTVDAARQRELGFARELRSENTVLFVSRLEGDKQPLLLLDAFALVRAEVSDAQLVVVGSGSWAARTRHHAEALGLGESVVFTGAVYDEQQLAPLFVNSKVFAYPAAIGLSLLHAFSYGLPVVTSAKTEHHNPEVDALVPNENGLTYVT